MKPTLAKTSFQSGADDALATPDVYNDAPQSPIGAIQDSVNSGNSIQGLSIGGGLGDFLSKDIKAFGSQFSQLEKGIKTVTSVLNGDTSLIKDLSKTMVSDLLASAGYSGAAVELAGALINGENPSSALGAIATAIPEVKVIMDGVDVIINAKDIGSVEDLLAVAEKVTGIAGISNIIEIGPTLSIVRGLVDKANLLGIPALADALINTIDNPEDKKRVEIASALGAAKGSNSIMLDDIVRRYTGAVVKQAHPKIVKELLANYSHPKGTLVPTLLDKEALVAQCDQLDENWAYSIRDSHQVYHTDAFIGMSKDARELLLLDGVLRPIVLMSSQHPVTSLIGLSQRQYPYTPISFA